MRPDDRRRPHARTHLLIAYGEGADGFELEIVALLPREEQRVEAIVLRDHIHGLPALTLLRLQPV